MSWAYRIILFFGAFIGFMSFMFYKCLQQDFDLVAPDYYAKEIAFQQQIDKINNTASLSQKPNWEFDDQNFILKFPNDITEGKVTFFRPSDDELDFEEIIKLNDQKQQKFSLELFKHGFYMVQLSWSDGTKEYYLEKKVRFP